MKIQNLKKKLLLPFLAFGALGLTNCGGIQEEARVATAIQTMMVLAVEAAIRYNTDDGLNAATPDSIECTAGGTYEPDTDLSSIITFINNGTGGTPLSGNFSFSNCKMTLCGSTLTINGDSGFELSGDSSGTDRQLTIKFIGDNLTTSGIIVGTPNFDYNMNVIVENNSLSGIEITNATTPNPLNYNDKEYRASELAALARGC